MACDLVCQGEAERGEVKRIKQLEAQTLPERQSRKGLHPVAPARPAWLITARKPLRSSQTSGPQPGKGLCGRKRENKRCVHTHVAPPATFLPTPPWGQPCEIPRGTQPHPATAWGFLSVPFRAADGLPKTRRGEIASFLPLKPPETGPPAVPGTGEGQSAEGQASPLAHLPASIFDGMVVVLGRIVAGWVQVSVEGKGRL